MPEIFNIILTDDEITEILEAMSDACLLCEFNCKDCDRKVLREKLTELRNRA